MPIEKINNYLFSSLSVPYFLVLGDENYLNIKSKMTELGLNILRISDYCKCNDKLPDIDEFYEKLKETSLDGELKKFVVLGLGEYLALCENREAINILYLFKEMNLEKTKAVILLRGINSKFQSLRTDPRFDERCFSIVGSTDFNLSITLSPPDLNLNAINGIKPLLIQLENGYSGNIIVNTSIRISDCILTVNKISDAYEAILFFYPSFNLERSCGKEDFWQELFIELSASGELFENFFEQYWFNNIEENFYKFISGTEYKNWLFFITLKINLHKLTNSYLIFVLENTREFKNFKENITNAIINILYSDKRFDRFYKERKFIVSKFPESDIANFIINNRKNVNESIHKLTDNTIIECEEIVAWVSRYGIPNNLHNIYPNLSAYLNKYIFNCGEFSSLYTDYFQDYKKQKVLNNLDEDFLNKVDDFALNRKFNRLQTRNEIIEGFEKKDSYLYWLDALGVEYLAFISDLINSRNLSISIKIARAELPTITSINRDFFDEWQGSLKEKNDELDHVKHNHSGGYNFENNNLPIHLAKELDIIEKVIDKAATGLALRHYKRFLIISDHGASRLAVLRRKEEKYDTDTQGKHSGRCCELFKNHNLPFAAEENGYLVLADYGRFKGSRAANVEVHGGASLEEVIIPIIELTLKNENTIISLADENVTVDFRHGTTIVLYTNTSLSNASVIFNGLRYDALKIDDNHFKVCLLNLKRAGNYLIEVYDGDNYIGNIDFKAEGKSGKINNDFDNLF